MSRNARLIGEVPSTRLKDKSARPRIDPDLYQHVKGDRSIGGGTSGKQRAEDTKSKQNGAGGHVGGTSPGQDEATSNFVVKDKPLPPTPPPIDDAFLFSPPAPVASSSKAEDPVPPSIPFPSPFRESDMTEASSSGKYSDEQGHERKRSLTRTVLDTAVNASLFGAAIGLTAYKLYTKRAAPSSPKLTHEFASPEAALRPDHSLGGEEGMEVVRRVRSGDCGREELAREEEKVEEQAREPEEKGRDSLNDDAREGTSSVGETTQQGHSRSETNDQIDLEPPPAYSENPSSTPSPKPRQYPSAAELIKKHSPSHQIARVRTRRALPLLSSSRHLRARESDAEAEIIREAEENSEEESELVTRMGALDERMMRLIEEGRKALTVKEVEENEGQLQQEPVDAERREGHVCQPSSNAGTDNELREDDFGRARTGAGQSNAADLASPHEGIEQSSHAEFPIKSPFPHTPETMPVPLPSPSQHPQNPSEIATPSPSDRKARRQQARRSLLKSPMETPPSIRAMLQVKQDETAERGLQAMGDPVLEGGKGEDNTLETAGKERPSISSANSTPSKIPRYVGHRSPEIPTSPTLTPMDEAPASPSLSQVSRIPHHITRRTIPFKLNQPTSPTP